MNIANIYTNMEGTDRSENDCMVGKPIDPVVTVAKITLPKAGTAPQQHDQSSPPLCRGDGAAPIRLLRGGDERTLGGPPPAPFIAVFDLTRPALCGR